MKPARLNGKQHQVFITFDCSDERLYQSNAIGNTDSGKYVDPEFMAVLYDYNGTDWTREYIRVTGRRWLKTGGLGNMTTVEVAMSDLPPRIRSIVDENVPE